MTIIMNRRIAAIPHLHSFLADHPRAVVGWGRKPSGWRAGVAGAVLRRPVLRLEDGFLRSLGRHDAPLSLLLDDTGAYYDAAAPSAMERAIRHNAARRSVTGADTGHDTGHDTGAATDSHAQDARALARLWRAGGLSKYNHHPDPREPMDQPYVLVADQCLNDLSLTGGLAGRGAQAQDRFDRMLHAALDDHPDCLVLVKTHPDLLSHGRAGLCRPDRLHHPRLRIMADPCHPARLIAGARAVYTLTSLIGFEGLIWGRPVHCFAMPFYAGWGLTLDDMPPPERRRPSTPAMLEDLVHAAFIDLARYADPLTGQRWSAQQAFTHAAHHLAQRRRDSLRAWAMPGAPGQPRPLILAPAQRPAPLFPHPRLHPQSRSG